MRITLALAIFLIGLNSCKIEPGTIEYGKDGCHFCSMTIVDNQHASEIVTDKGKVFKYDAVECMINDLKNHEEGSIGLMLVNNYSNPGELIPASTATYLISKEIPSPMGAFLSAFNDEKEASEIRQDKGGDLYDWQSIRDKIK